MSFQGKYIVVGIDGTGSDEWHRDNAPTETHCNSHIHQFVNDFRAQNSAKIYFNGPGEQFGGQVFGRGSEETIENVMRFILRHLRIMASEYRYARGLEKRHAAFDESSFNYACSNPSGAKCVNFMSPSISVFRDWTKLVRICLVGHSRGGMIAIHVASRLPIPVFFLGLYDAVDMHFSLDSDTILNVEHTYHAVRDPSRGSRISWGNTGLSSKGRYHSKTFRTSHGGIGGDPVFYPTNIFDDFSCAVNTTSGLIANALGYDRRKICLDESFRANEWIRSEARGLGLPI